jgi:hypothetical protein
MICRKGCGNLHRLHQTLKVTRKRLARKKKPDLVKMASEAPYGDDIAANHLGMMMIRNPRVDPVRVLRKKGGVQRNDQTGVVLGLDRRRSPDTDLVLDRLLVRIPDPVHLVQCQPFFDSAVLHHQQNCKHSLWNFDQPIIMKYPFP